MFRSSAGGAVCAVALIVLAMLAARAELRQKQTDLQADPSLTDATVLARPNQAGDIASWALSYGGIWSVEIWPDRRRDGRACGFVDALPQQDQCSVFASPAEVRRLAVSFNVLTSSGQLAQLYDVPGNTTDLRVFDGMLEPPRDDDRFAMPRGFTPIFAKKLEDP